MLMIPISVDHSESLITFQGFPFLTCVISEVVLIHCKGISPTRSHSSVRPRTPHSNLKPFDGRVYS
jgi:hypothetical protein